MKTLRFFYWILFFVAMAAPLGSFAQTPKTEDDEEEVNLEDLQLPRYDEAKLTLNGAEFQLTENVEVTRNSKLELHVTRLQPGSYVKVKIQKGGATLKTHQFMANQVGEIILEINTGPNKIKGEAEVSYITSSGKKITRSARVSVL